MGTTITELFLHPFRLRPLGVTSVTTCTQWTLGYSTKSLIQNYTVTEDNTEPEIVGVWQVYPQVSYITPWDSVRIRANITDSGSGVENVTLFYGFNEPIDEVTQQSFSKISMNFVGGDMYNCSYDGVIPPQENDTIVWYYIEASDFAANKRVSNGRSYTIRYGDSSYLWISIKISEIDTKNLTAMLTVNFYARLPSRDEPEFFRVEASNIERDPEPFEIKQVPFKRFFYEGSVTWNVQLFGNPNCFPYDHYNLNLTFQIGWSAIDKLDIRIGNFSDYKLNHVWKLEPLNNRTDYASKDPKLFADLQIVRKPIDRLPVILPIFGVFFLLGATLLVGVADHFKNRLTVYLAPFVFIVGFLYTLESWAPTRFGFAIAELLVISLILGTVVFVVFSFISASLSTSSYPVLFNVCFDSVAMVFVFIFLIFVFTVPNEGSLLFSIPLPDRGFIVFGIVYGLVMRLYFNLKPLKTEFALLRTNVAFRIRKFRKKRRTKRT